MQQELSEINLNVSKSPTNRISNEVEKQSQLCLLNNNKKIII
jgi:hypothetical protein